MPRCFPTLIALSVLFITSTGLAANNEVIIVEGTCPTDQHLDLEGSCVCTDSRETLVDFECAPDPGRLFGDIVLDICELFGICGGRGGGGGGGGNPDPQPEPEPEEDACALNQRHCDEALAECASIAFGETAGCPFDMALSKCAGGLGSMVFPGGAEPDCRVISKTGRIFCAFPDALENRPFVGDLEGLLGRCINDWVGSGELADDIAACQRDAALEMEACQKEVNEACDEEADDEGCPLVLPPTVIEAQFADSAPQPEHGVFLRAKVRTKGETAIDTEAFVRNATKSTCYWHLLDGLDVPEATLYCKAGDAWDDVGASRFLMADGDQYLADGACGIATQDGVASGSGTFHWKLERDAEERLVGAKMKSVAGHIVGSLDGAHPYYGDCKVTGKAIEERDVPSGLRELIRQER